MKPSVARRGLEALEWPTLGLALVIYGGWALATLYHARLPIPLLVLIGGWLAAWHGSLQHEIIHDHPTPWSGVNTALALPPLSLWFPFDIYRRSHRMHHVLEHLTDPERDPESRYLAPGGGFKARLARAIGAAQSSLVGRLILGPAIDAGLFLTHEVLQLLRGDFANLRAWIIHGLLVAGVLAWLRFVCAMSLWDYGLCFVYPGAVLTLIRSFAEHRADPDPARRSAVVERAPLLGLLFLNNNLHAAHHASTSLAWYRLPAFYRRERARLLAANGGLVYAGYGEVFRRYLFRPHDRLIHPAAMAPARA